MRRYFYRSVPKEQVDSVLQHGFVPVHTETSDGEKVFGVYVAPSKWQAEMFNFGEAVFRISGLVPGGFYHGPELEDASEVEAYLCQAAYSLSKRGAG